MIGDVSEFAREVGREVERLANEWLEKQEEPYEWVELEPEPEPEPELKRQPTEDKKRHAKAPLAECWRCPYLAQPVVYGVGPEDAEMVIVGEGPGTQEVKEGQPFIGPSGQYLDTALARYGVQRGDVRITNATLCLPDADKERTLPEAMACCHTRLMAELRGPRHILAVGQYAANAVGIPVDSITKARGRRRGANGWIVTPTLHPAYILRTAAAGMNLNLSRDFFDDVRRWARRDTPYHPASPDIRLITDVPEGVYVLQDMQQRAEWNADSGPTFVALDFESESLEPHSKLILANMWDGRTDDNERPIVYLFNDEVIKSVDWERALKKLAASPAVILCGWNVGFDHKLTLAHYGEGVTFRFDGRSAHYALDERTGGHSLKNVATRMFEVDDWSEGIKNYVKEGDDDGDAHGFGLIPLRELCVYAAWDAVYTQLTCEALYHSLSDKLKDFVLNFLTPLEQASARMEYRGLGIDNDYRRKLIRDWSARLGELEQELVRLVNELGVPLSGKPKRKGEQLTFNLGKNGATEHVRDVISHLILEADLNGRDMPDIVVTPRSGKLSTDDGQLARLEGLSPELDEFLSRLIDYRRIHKLLSTYVEGKGCEPDGAGRIHSSFNLCGQVSGRPSSSKPNVLNLPRGSTHYGKVLRPMYRAVEGHSIVVCDYSQLELRVLAWYSEDPYLLGAYREGRDLHLETAWSLYGKFDKSDPDYSRKRTVGKTTNFNFPYALGSLSSTVERLAESKISLSPEEMARLEVLMQQRLAGFLRWTKQIEQQVLSKRFVESAVNGRRRRFEIIDPRNTKAVREHTKLAVNHLGQSASDLTGYAILRCEDGLRDLGGAPILNWFDAVWAEVPTDRVVEAGRLITESMVAVAYERLGRKLPFAADCKSGQHFGELKDVQL